MRRLLPDVADEVDIHTEYVVPDDARGDDDDWHLRMNFVSSVDGAVTADGASAGLSTPGDRQVLAALRDLADVILVGAGTARAEGYGPARPSDRRRALRRSLGLADTPMIAVVSSALDLDPDAELYSASDAHTVVFTHGAAPAQRRAALEKVTEVVTVGADGVDLSQALAHLAGRGLWRVLSEGGPHLFTELLRAGVVDEMCLTLSPLLTGPGAGRIVAGADLADPARLRMTRILEEDGALFLRYAVARGTPD